MPNWEPYSDGTERGFYLDLYYLRLIVVQRMGENVWRAELRGCLSSGPEGTFESAELAQITVVEFAKLALEKMVEELK